MTYRRDWFSELRSCTDEEVSLGDGTICKVLGRGTVHIERYVKDQWTVSRIEDVLYVPNLNKNLFSVGACINKNFRVVFNKNTVDFFRNNELKAQGIKQDNNLFRMMFKVVTINHANLVSNAKSDLKRWHERLGHVNYRYVQQTLKDGLIDYSSDNTGSEDKFCEACQYGKQHRLPFQSITHKKSMPGEVIYSDVGGKMSQPSLGGSNFYVNFKDDSTGFRVIYFIKHKSDVLDKLKQFVNLVETHHQRRVKTLHVDNGREYCNEAVTKYLCEKGINMETTAPYTPEQNGRAERDNRYIVECARAMLHAKNLPVKLWAEAVNTACYILNRIPTTSNKGITPYEAWTGKKPRLDHIRIFGSDAFMHIPKQLRKKWDKK